MFSCDCCVDSLFRLDLLEERTVWQINFDGSWGDDGSLRGTVHTRLEPLSPEEDEGEDDEIDKDNENFLAPHDDDDDEDVDILEKKDGENKINSKTSSSIPRKNKFKFLLEGNITTSIRNLEVVNLRLNHVHHSYLNMKTDVDVQVGEILFFLLGVVIV
jgi:hypothetical protein